MSSNPAACEPLEDRILLRSSISIIGRQLVIRANRNSANTVTVGLRSDNKTVVVIVNHGTQNFYNSSDFKSVKVIGGSFADTLVADQSLRSFPISMTIIGGGGDDTLGGGDAADLISGGDGNDLINTGAGDDTVLAGNGDDTVNCGAGNKLVFGDAGNDTIYGGRGDDVLFGGDGNDSIVARSTRNELFGDAGNDTLTGVGRDSLWGGGGADILTGGIFRTAGEIDHFNKLISVLRPADPAV